MNRLLAIAALLVASVLGQAAEEQYYTPWHATQVAQLDSAAVLGLKDPTLAPDECVWLSLHNIPKEQRPIVRAIADFVANSLNSKYREIKRAAVLPAGSPDPLVLRINLRDYGISKAAWTEFVETGSGDVPLNEPYFYYRLEKIVEQFKEVQYTEYEQRPTGRYYHGGQPEYQQVPVTKTRKEKSGVKREVQLEPGPWVQFEANVTDRGKIFRSLQEVSCNKYPIVRADWFIVYATWAPAYYRLIGLQRKNDPEGGKDKFFLEDDFEKLAGADLKAALPDIVAAITDSKLVAHHNRILQRFTTLRGITGGAYWRSKDTSTGIDSQDYMLHITKFADPDFAAQEIITNWRNGLHGYALTDNKRRLLSVAAPNVALHSDAMPTRLKDKQIFAGRNCMFCHGPGYLLPSDKVRGMARDQIALLIADKTKEQEIARAVREAFQPVLKPIIDTDNAKYQAAVLAATGMDAAKLSDAFEKLVADYYDGFLSLEKMALESGMPPDKLEAKLKQGINLHYSLVGVIQQPPELTARKPWERDGYTSMMLYLYPPPQK